MDPNKKWQLLLESKYVTPEEERGFITFLNRIGYPDQAYLYCRFARLEEYLLSYRNAKKLIRTEISYDF